MLRRPLPSLTQHAIAAALGLLTAWVVTAFRTGILP
ncbi:MAG: hypothetical protein JWR10_3410 [Rubritepida sp.]|nr:hypothetical protein [Rubritepida sp.]